MACQGGRVADTYNVTGDLPPWAPALYREFRDWVQTQSQNCLGYFELRASAATPWEDWDAAARTRVAENAFTFMSLPDGSELLLVRVAEAQPHPVVLLGSEGQLDVVADSLEAFLHALSNGETSLSDLDELDRNARTGLQQWLRGRKIKLPNALPFDFEAWLADEPPTLNSAGAAQPSSPLFVGDAATLAHLALDPVMVELISMLGRRSDDPVLIEFMAKTVAKKCPPTLTQSKWLGWSKSNVELLFDPDAQNAKYPPIKKGKSFIPYLTTLNVSKTGLTLPFDAKPILSDDEATARFGRVIEHPGGRRWHAPLIAQRDVVLSYYPDAKLIYLRIKGDGEALSREA